MGFTKDLGLQLYVEDVAKEKEFYKAAIEDIFKDMIEQSQLWHQYTRI